MIWSAFLFVWSNLAFAGACAGLVAVWFIWPRFALVGVPVAVLIAVSAALGAFGWGELRYIDGRDAGAAVERAKWEKSFAILKLELENEKTKARNEIEKIRSDFVQSQKAKEAIKQEAAVSNARVIQSLLSDMTEPKTITCEKANEQIIIPACPNPYSVRVDPRIVRNLQTSRHQNGTGKNAD